MEYAQLLSREKLESWYDQKVKEEEELVAEDESPEAKARNQKLAQELEEELIGEVEEEEVENDNSGQDERGGDYLEF